MPPASALDLFDDDLGNDKIFEPKSVPPSTAERAEEKKASKSEASTSYVQETPSALGDKKLSALSAQDLFNDDLDDDNDDIFGSVSNSKTETVTEQQSPKSLPPTSSVPTTPPTPPIPPISPASNEKKLPASTALELFDDDLDNNDIFGTQTAKETKTETKEQKKSPNSVSKTSNVLEQPSASIDEELPISGASDLFHDGMDDGDEIFGSKIETESKKTAMKSANPPYKSIPPKKGTKPSLFGDVDDSNDLFGGPPPLPEPVKQVHPKKLAIKIFSDDSSDDDLFGGGGKSAKKNPPKPKPIDTQAPSKRTKDSKSSDKLFSDSDDDDLFGAKPKAIGKL